MPEHPYLQWPVFRRSVVAAFLRSLTQLNAKPVASGMSEVPRCLSAQPVRVVGSAVRNSQNIRRKFPDLCIRGAGGRKREMAWRYIPAPTGRFRRPGDSSPRRGAAAASGDGNPLDVDAVRAHSGDWPARASPTRDGFSG